MTVQKNSKARGKALGERLDALTAKFSSIAVAISKVEERFDSALFELSELLEEVGALSHPARRPPSRADSIKDQQKKLLARISAAGAGSLTIERTAAGQGIVRVDGGPCFELPPLLCDLFEILADKVGEGPPGVDGFPPWKGPKEIAARLEVEYGRSFSKHSIIQNVSRLRKILLNQAGVNPELIQRNRLGAYRFALRVDGGAQPKKSEESYQSS